MQIKRFEAADMTEALRLVKRDLGDDAVILSAKEIRPGGFFSALKKKHVEITAAIDYQTKAQPSSTAFTDHLAEQLDEESSADRVSLSARQDDANPGDSDLSPREMQRRSHPRPAIRSEEGRDPLPSGFSGLRGYGAARSASTEAPPSREPVRRRSARRLAAPFYSIAAPAAGPQRIALVGPSGAGKSTTIVKLARQCQLMENKKTALISLDRFRMGANGLLENVSRIMNLSVSVIRDTEALMQTIDTMADHDVVLIDTPGMSGSDRTMLDDVGRMLESVRPTETHLVLNATVREDILTRTVDIFRPLGTTHLLLTHIDEIGRLADASDVLVNTALPSSFYGTGVDLFDGLQIARDEPSDDCRPSRPLTGAQFSGRCADSGIVDADEKAAPIDLNRVKYVANRNSELFHHPTCKSVKRINAENIAAFNSVEQAMEEGFKPCRACCNISTLKKPAFHAFGFQRASAL